MAQVQRKTAHVHAQSWLEFDGGCIDSRRLCDEVERQHEPVTRLRQHHACPVRLDGPVLISLVLRR